MSSAPTFTTILGWCQKHNCQQLEITNLEDGLIEVEIVHRAYQIVLHIDPNTSLTTLTLKKLVDGLDYSTIFVEEKISFEECLKIIQEKVIL